MLSMGFCDRGSLNQIAEGSHNIDTILREGAALRAMADFAPSSSNQPTLARASAYHSRTLFASES